MNDNAETARDSWGSRVGFILAAAGSAVGLGNLWRFPFITGQNGGGAFVLLYLIFLIFLGFALMLSEIVVGRFTNLNPVGAYRKIKKQYAWVGMIGIIAGFLILSFYSVIGGWVIHYAYTSLASCFMGPSIAQPANAPEGEKALVQICDTEHYSGCFRDFISSTSTPILFHAIFMGLTLLIVIGGVQNGIEKYSKILMPALFVMLLVIMIRALTLEGASEGIKFFLKPDFSKINGSAVLAAMGQVFFSLSLGMGAIITYGSYLNKAENIPSSALIISLLDTLVSIMAGLTILPAVFAFGMQPTEGPKLMFVTLPAVFAQMPMGYFFGFVFFLLILFAAVTSSISLLEGCVSMFVDEWKWSRKKATLIVSVISFILGIPCSLGYGIWSKVTLIGSRDILDSFDFVASNVLLPLSGLCLCLFIAYVWGLDKKITTDENDGSIKTEESDFMKEVTNSGTVNLPFKGFWIFCIKYLAPIAILIIFISGIM